MNRTLLIIIGVVMALVLIAVWVYLLFFNQPGGGDDNFADLNFANTDREVVDDTSPTFSEEEALVEVSDDSVLKQLTTEPVIGFQEVAATASSTPVVYYLKPGTGHMMSIDLETGEEERVSGTTIPNASRGVISITGQLVLIQAGQGHQAELLLGELSSSSEELKLTTLSETVLDFTITTNNELLYLEGDGGYTTIKQYQPETKTTKTILTIPFAETAITWGNEVGGVHYIYPKASGQLEGYLYQVANGKFSRLPVAGYGLTAYGTADYVIISRQLTGRYQSAIFNRTLDQTKPLEMALLPEKCVLENTKSSFVCADSTTALKTDMPDLWYEGGVSYVDNFWRIDTASSSASLLLDTKKESGRELDIINLVTGQNSGDIYFQNKNDQALWLYQISR
ncbi:hypothetical protein KC851_03265 [Candidatus Kaiserbacteria bacterium]|nr:hypothetical protein [Candidatus Kaiserbacteria bacterium]